MGAGHHAIDDILQVASGLDLAGKLTGAGGGGTVLILLRPGIFEIKLKKTQFYFEQLWLIEIDLPLHHRYGGNAIKSTTWRTVDQRLQTMESEVG